MPRSPSKVDKTTGACPQCNQTHTKCHGHNNRGKPCGLNPIRGGNVCHRHGGAAPQVRAAAMRRLARGDAERAVRTALDLVDVPTIGDPVEALLRVVEEIVAFKDFLAERVAELGVELHRVDDKEREQLRAHVALYERALERSAKFLAEVVRLNLEERLTRIQEDTARNLETALLATLEQLGYRDSDQARAVLASELRVIDGGLAA